MAKEETIVIEKRLLNSPAFRGLSGAQKTVLFDFLMRRKLEKYRGEWQIKNNGEIVYTYDEAGNKGIPRPTFMACLDALISRGFIDVYHSGNGGKKGDVSLYGISNRWKGWGTNSFVEKSRPKDPRNKRGFALHHERRKKNISNENCNRNITENLT